MIATRLAPDARILLVRPDKIGDLVLTTPALAALRRTYPKAYIAFLCRSYAAPVLENNPDLNAILKSDEPGTSLWDLAGQLRAQRFDAAVHFYLDRRCEIATFLARVPLRVGPASKWTAVFLNDPVFQSRSRAERHEAEYNFDLVRACGVEGEVPVPRIHLTDAEIGRGREILAALPGLNGNRPVILHPGSAGSAKSWPLDSFIRLAGAIAELPAPAVFTAGRGEEGILEQVRAAAGRQVSAIPAGSLSLRELSAVLSQARLVVANSTGPLHIASALGVPTLSFYPGSPPVTTARRWGPYGNPARNRILTPSGASDPMSDIPVEAALVLARQLMQGEK